MNSQKSLMDQLDELDRLAAKHGLYDAQDWLRTVRCIEVKYNPDRSGYHAIDCQCKVYFILGK